MRGGILYCYWEEVRRWDYGSKCLWKERHDIMLSRMTEKCPIGSNDRLFLTYLFKE